MTNKANARILIDAREFRADRMTGIGRVVEGLADALAALDWIEIISLGSFSQESLPKALRSRRSIQFLKLSKSFLRSEYQLSRWCRRGYDLFVSPYPKLPIFGTKIPSIHIIHDVLDLTHPAYKKRIKVYFDKARLKFSIKRASLTWYDSKSSYDETARLFKFAGMNPRIRHLAISSRFQLQDVKEGKGSLHRYGLEPGYVLVVGNGLPHKNLGVLLEIRNRIQRPLVFTGVKEEQQSYWRERYDLTGTKWLGHIDDEVYKDLLANAFCLAQPSTAEGYGYPPLEAMACGTPAVISNIPVLKEATGGNALTADAACAEDWQSAIRELENPTAYQSLAARGRKWVEPLIGRKGWEKHISDIREIIEAS